MTVPVFSGCGPTGALFTNDLDEIRSALLRTAPFGLTAFYDAVVVGIDHLRAVTRDRKAFVVLSDGRDNANRCTLECGSNRTTVERNNR
jgi:Mg-chelatase subunit ChlD